MGSDSGARDEPPPTDPELGLQGEETLDSVDQDAFGHEAHVDTLYDIVRSVTPPWHVALYGTWGSGKSTIVDLLYGRIRDHREAALKAEADGNDTDGASGGYPSDTVCVSLDAWKHADESLRTELLLDLNRSLAEELGRCFGEAVATGDEDDAEKGVLNTDEIVNTLYNVQHNEETKTKPLSDVWNDLSGWVKVPLVLAVLLGVGYLLPSAGVVQYGGAIREGVRWLATLLAVTGLVNAFAGALLDELREARQEVDVVEAGPQREWSGAFERLFNDIIKEAQEKYQETRPDSSAGGFDRIVITIDDIDRCQSQTVLDILVALKSFLSHEKCIYIIPCDEDALHKHLEAADEGEYLGDKLNQQNFLAKFFETELEIPEIPDDQLATYFDEQAENYDRSFDPQSLQLLKDAELNTPRRVVRALNRLVVLEDLAQNRGVLEVGADSSVDTSTDVGEDGTTAGEAAVSVDAGSPTESHARDPQRAFLAFVSVLQKDYPRFHAEIERDPDLLTEIYDELGGGFAADTRQGLDPLLDEIGVAEARRDTLLPFLMAAKEVVTAVENPEPYFRLSGTSPDPVDIFEARFERNRVESLRQLIDQESKRDDDTETGEISDDEPEPLSAGDDAEATSDTLESFANYVIRRVRDEAAQFETLPTAVDIAAEFSPQHHRDIAEAVLAALENEESGDLLGRLALTRLEPVLTVLPRDDKRRLLQLYVRAIVGPDGLRRENFASIIDGPGEPLTDETVQEAFTETLQSARRQGLISDDTLAEILSTVRTERPELYTPALVGCK